MREHIEERLNLKGILIRSGYPRIRKRFGKISGYIALLRPFTLIAPMFAGLFGTLAPLKTITIDHVFTAIYVGVTLALAQACGQVINQYADADLDKEIKPYRPIPSQVVTREEALGLAWILALISVGRAFTISVEFGITVLVLLFFAVFYSLSPFSPRRINPMLNVMWMATSRGFIPAFATISIFGSVEEAIPYSLLAFIFVMGFQSTKDVPDVCGDRKYGIKTIPSEYGIKGLTALMITSTVVYAAASVMFNKLIFSLVLPMAIASIITINRESSLTENTYAWTLFYLGLATIYVLIFISYRI